MIWQLDNDIDPHNTQITPPSVQDIKAFRCASLTLGIMLLSCRLTLATIALAAQ
ncbi:hypothetical protein [Suttonella indologenes]|uniref:hypothetical protein n=1 Tax=Suttonella indologenes TaxID=13276 RepID=UPI001559AC88|nr:hypothetical protein [Suttonella indologenes]